MKNPSVFPCSETQFDLVVCGGGVGGVITAVMAARKGLSVALLDNKAGLGGNACSEIGVSIEGAHFFSFFAHMREGGPVEELKERIAAIDPGRQYGQNSTVMLLWCREAGVQVYSELLIDEVVTEGRRIVQVAGAQGGTERRLAFRAAQFVDATGDGSVAALAGAACMTGREARDTFGETLAPAQADTGIMGASLLFRASEKKEPSTFTRPDWAYEYRTEADLPHRMVMAGPVSCGFWWIEYAGDHDDPIGEYEQLRVELSKCLYGCWAFLKNAPARKMAHWSLDRPFPAAATPWCWIPITSTCQRRAATRISTWRARRSCSPPPAKTRAGCGNGSTVPGSSSTGAATSSPCPRLRPPRSCDPTPPPRR